MHVFDGQILRTAATKSSSPSTPPVPLAHDRLAYSEGQRPAERGGTHGHAVCDSVVPCGSTLKDTEIDASDSQMREALTNMCCGSEQSGGVSVACGAAEEHVNLRGRQHSSLTGPKIFPPQFAEDEECHGGRDGQAAVVSPCGRGHEKEVPPMESVAIRIGSWNLAGASSKAVKAILTHVLEYDIIGFQEYAKQKDAGWQLLKGDDFHGVVHQNYVMYRSLAIFYRKNKFQLLRKRQTQRGLWIHLKHLESDKTIWVGCCHFPNNEPVEEIARLHREFFTIPREVADQKIAVGDFNVQFTWSEVGTGIEPKTLTNKWARLRQQAADQGLRQATPQTHQLDAPTFILRKGNVASAQIDGAFLQGDSPWSIRICRESRHEVGTRHDRIELEVTVRKQKGDRKKFQAGGPRVVARPIPTQTEISQHQLEAIAQKYTKPLSLGPRFAASVATRELQDLAKQHKTAEHWKTYLAALRKEKQAWKEDRLQKAVDDWKMYKRLTKPSKPWGDDYMMRADTVDPVGDIGNCFTKVFHDPQQCQMQSELRNMAEGLKCDGDVCPFTTEEVAESIAEGKRGKATGPDAIPTEMLQHMCADPVSLNALTSFYNGLLVTGSTPDSWDHSISTLIPKITPPGGPKDLRPIALASHVSKSFSRMVLKRLECALQIRGSQQCAAKHRQPADFVWSAVHVVHLAREWKVDAYLLKLDLQRAFDSVLRAQLGRKILEWDGGEHPFEVRCLLRLLESSQVTLRLPWGEVGIDSNSGVKQGAVESPILFAKLMDDILSGTQMYDEGYILQGIDSTGCCFMDDVVTWRASIQSLQQCVNHLLPVLKQFGLEINPGKCRLMCVRGPRNLSLDLNGYKLFPLEEGEPLSVMNLLVGPTATEGRIMEQLIDKARKKYYSIQHILCSKTSLVKRIAVLNKVVYGTIRWIVGVLFPSKTQQCALNHFQYQCIKRMMGLKRAEGELGVDFEVRSLRAARVMVANLGERRWGDVFLAAYWEFTGHRVRAGHREVPTEAGKLSAHRGLDWWEREQRLSQGRRHGHHFPFLMGCERRISKVVGSSSWRTAACNRQQWQGFKDAWMRSMSVEWSSGRQLSLENM